jgi:hypothetical protein
MGYVVPRYTEISHFRAPYKNSAIYTGVGADAFTASASATTTTAPRTTVTMAPRTSMLAPTPSVVAYATTATRLPPLDQKTKEAMVDSLMQMLGIHAAMDLSTVRAGKYLSVAYPLCPPGVSGMTSCASVGVGPALCPSSGAVPCITKLELTLHMFKMAMEREKGTRWSDQLLYDFRDLIKKYGMFDARSVLTLLIERGLKGLVHPSPFNWAQSQARNVIMEAVARQAFDKASGAAGLPVTGAPTAEIKRTVTAERREAAPPQVQPPPPVIDGGIVPVEVAPARAGFMKALPWVGAAVVGVGVAWYALRKKN